MNLNELDLNTDPTPNGLPAAPRRQRIRFPDWDHPEQAERLAIPGLDKLVATSKSSAVPGPASKRPAWTRITRP